MNLGTFKQKLHVIGLRLYHTHHHTWAVILEHDIPHSKLSKETDCAEISADHQSYYVSKPQYLSKTAVLLIHAFASTPVTQRSNNATIHYYILCVPINNNRVQDWFINTQGLISSLISNNKQRFINYDKYHLSKAQLMKVEQSLLAHGIDRITVSPVNKQE